MFSKGLYLSSFMCCLIILFHHTFEVNGQARDVCANDVTVRATEEKPTDPKIASVEEVMEEGMVRFNAGRYRDAIKCWTLLINSIPQLKAIGLRRRAECYEQLGDKASQNSDLDKLEDLRNDQRLAKLQTQYGPAPRRPLRIHCADLD